jgi:hypothetical protein
MPARLLLLCLLFRSSWLTVEGDRQVGASRLLHRRGGRAAAAVSVRVAVGVPKQLSQDGGQPSRLFRSGGERQSIAYRDALLLPAVAQARIGVDRAVALRSQCESTAGEADRGSTSATPRRAPASGIFIDRARGRRPIEAAAHRNALIECAGPIRVLTTRRDGTRQPFRSGRLRRSARSRRRSASVGRTVSGWCLVRRRARNAAVPHIAGIHSAIAW